MTGGMGGDADQAPVHDLLSEQLTALALIEVTADGNPGTLSMLLGMLSREELEALASCLAVWHVDALARDGRDVVATTRELRRRLVEDAARD